jgi:hypothetical protein
MKGKLITFLILLSVLLVLGVYFWKPSEKLETNQPIKDEEMQDSYKTFTYVITEISGNDYYGQSLDGTTKIYFNRKNVKFPIEDNIQVKDKILAYVESENHIGGLVKIEKLE